MKCRTAQQELSSRSEPSPAVQQHLESCEDCRRFADDLHIFRSLSDAPAKTPPVLKEVTLERCRAMLAEKAATHKRPFWMRCRRLLDSPQFVAATAILGVIILGTLAAMQINDVQDRDASFLIKISIVQIIAQNLIAALFMPALLMLGNRSRGRLFYSQS